MRKKLFISLLLPVIIFSEDTFVQQDTQEERDERDIKVSNFNSEQDISHDQDDFDDDDDTDDALETDHDEFDLPEYARGNWYKKQGILKESHDVYQKVRHEEGIVAQFEKIFIDKKNILTNMLEAFSQSLGIPLAHAYSIISDEIVAIERTRAEPDLSPKVSSGKASLPPEERIKAAQKEEIKELLIHIKNDIDIINDLYKALDHAMGVLMQQITASHNFEQKAFDSYEKITHVLSDQVARQLYAEILTARENIVNIAEYIKGDFTHYFEELSQNCVKSLEIIQQQFNALKEHGIDIVVLQAEAQKAAESKKITTESKIKHDSSDNKHIEKSYYQYFIDLFLYIGNFFNLVIIWIKGFFV